MLKLQTRTEVCSIVDLLLGFFDGDRKGDSRVFSILAGVVTMLYPISAGVAVVWVIGLYAILYGALSIAFAFRAQKELK